MECIECGCYMDADAEVCPECGAEAVEDAVEDIRVFPREQALSVLKSPAYVITSVVWLVCFIMCCAYFAYSFVSLNSILTIIEGMFDGIYIPTGILMIGLGIAFALTGIPIMLNSIGLLISAIKARMGSCAGIGAVRAGFVVSLIFGLVEFALLVFALTYSLLNSGVAGSAVVLMDDGGTAAQVGFWITCGMIAVMFIVIIVFYAKASASMGIVRVAVEQNKCEQKSSVFAAFMSWFVAIMIGLLAISQLTAEKSTISWLNIGFMSTYALSYILLGAILMMFRRIEISDGMSDDYRITFPSGEKSSHGVVSSQCVYCGRVLKGMEVCACGRGGTKVPVGGGGMSDVPKRKMHRCVDCGRILYGEEKCTCTSIRGSGSSSVDGTSGGLRSTMRTKHRTGVGVTSGAAKKISDVDKKRFFDSGGDLD